MTPTKHTMSVLAQITSWIPDRIIENLAKKHRIQPRSFSATSHVISMVYAHLAHALSMNDIEKTGLLVLNRTQKSLISYNYGTAVKNNFEPRKARNARKRIKSLNHECTQMDTKNIKTV